MPGCADALALFVCLAIQETLNITDEQRELMLPSWRQYQEVLDVLQQQALEMQQVLAAGGAVNSLANGATSPSNANVSERHGLSWEQLPCHAWMCFFRELQYHCSPGAPAEVALHVPSAGLSCRDGSDHVAPQLPVQSIVDVRVFDFGYRIAAEGDAARDAGAGMPALRAGLRATVHGAIGKGRRSRGWCTEAFAMYRAKLICLLKYRYPLLITI